MSDFEVLIAILVMMAASWLPRILPLLLVRRRIQNRFARSFLYYVPYAVLATMTIPAIFKSTSSLWSATAGFGVAVLLGLRGRSLLTVAVGASAAVFIVEQVIRLL